MGSAPPDITELLLRWSAGDRAAFEQLTPVVYGELHRLARGLMAAERTNHTLSATALVHEAYLRLVGQREVDWQQRAHFFGAAAHVMRRVLIDHARRRRAAKRGGADTMVPGDLENRPAPGLFLDEVLALDAALESLDGLDARKAQVVEMKFFAGMTNPQIAAVLAVSEATVERDWKLARAWLIHALDGREPAQLAAEPP
jgi:RNA polymerase sigma factor (TIGR02999 family)